MNLRKIMPRVFGILIFSSIFLVFGYFLNLTPENDFKYLASNDLIVLIESKKVKEVTLKHSEAEIKDLEENSFVAKFENELVKETVLEAVTDFNAANETASIKLNVIASTENRNWLPLLNYLPFIILTILLISNIYFMNKHKEKSEVEK